MLDWSHPIHAFRVYRYLDNPDFQTVWRSYPWWLRLAVRLAYESIFTIFDRPAFALLIRAEKRAIRQWRKKNG